MVLEKVKEMKETTGLSYPAICGVCDIPYPTLSRWLSREKSKIPVVNKPGPRKVLPFELDKLKEQITNLKHGRKRTRGTGELRREYSSSLSRRELTEMVNLVRLDINSEKEKNMRRIRWDKPGVVWSMDDTELKGSVTGTRVFEHMVMDLGSKYKFPPVAGGLLKGAVVPQNLESLFKKYGVPLFLKRDNHGNLNSKEVNDVLEKYKVIPLNSPEYYSPYNGSIEHANREFKESLRDKMSKTGPDILAKIGLLSETVVNDLNHESRPCLNGENSCQRFFAGKMKYYKRQRRAIYDWIKMRTECIMRNMDDYSTKAFKSAWRIAAETWMRMNGFIFLSINGKVLPNFSLEKSHN